MTGDNGEEPRPAAVPVGPPSAAVGHVGGGIGQTDGGAGPGSGGGDGPRSGSVRDLLADRRVLSDSVAPPLVFVIVEAAAGLQWAAAAALGLSAVLVVVRLVRRHRLLYALSGLGGALIGVAVALWAGTVTAYFVPGIVSNAVTGVVLAVSVLVRRPLIAAVSMLIYGWPWAWYRHDRVRPAYSEITWAWAVFSLAKAALQGWLAQRQAIGALAAVRVLSGYPALAVMLAVTYFYVDWRLARLGAPDVEQVGASGSTEAAAT